MGTVDLPQSRPGHPPAHTTFSGSRGTRTHNPLLADTCFQDRLLIPSDDFRLSSNLNLKFSIHFRELESNQRRLVQSQASRPTATAPELFPLVIHHSGRRIRTSIVGFKDRCPTLRRSPTVAAPLRDADSSNDLRDQRNPSRGATRLQKCLVGVEPTCPAWKAGTSAARPKTRHSFPPRRKERELNPQGIAARRFSGPLPSPIGLPFRISQLSSGGRTRTSIVWLTASRSTFELPRKNSIACM